MTAAIDQGLSNLETAIAYAKITKVKRLAKIASCSAIAQSVGVSYKIDSFDPPAFMVRRSMPWGTVKEHGLYFVAYGASLDAYERALTRMVGAEDGIVDPTKATHALS